MVDKPILCIDFDGVIHSYEKGWQDGKIYGTITEGFFDWAYKANKFFRLVVYSSRSGETSKLFNMQLWMNEQQANYMKKNKIPLSVMYMVEFEYASEKPPAFLTIDDRAICFEGDWNKLNPEELLKFKPWNSKGER